MPDPAPTPPIAQPVTLPNPVLPGADEPPPGSSDSLKAMAAKFRAEWQPGNATARAEGSPLPQPRSQIATPGSVLSPTTASTATTTPAASPAPATSPSTAPANAPAAPQAAPTAPTEPAPMTMEEIQRAQEPPGTSSATREHFKRLGQSAASYHKLADERAAALKAANDKLAALEAETAKWKGLPATPDEIAKAIAERDEAKRAAEAATKRVEAIDFEKSDRFQNWWREGTDKHIKTALRLAPAEARDEFAKLLARPSDSARDAAIDKLLENVPQVSRRIIDSAISSLEGMHIQREEALADASKSYQQLKATERQEQERAREQSQARLNALTAKALAAAERYAAFKPGEHTPKDDVEMRQAFVQAAVAGRLDEDVLVAMPGAAAHALWLEEKELPRLRAELAKRDDLIAQLQGASPKPSTGGSGSPPNPPPKAAPDGSEFAAKMRELWPGNRVGA